MNFFILFILATFWGGSFVAIKIVLEHLPSFYSAMLRVGLSLIFVRFFLLILRKPVQMEWSLKWRSMVSGLFTQGLPFCFLFWGAHYVSPGLCGILNGTAPIWTFVLSLVMIKNDDDFSARKIIGLALGILGIVVIFWPLITFEKGTMEVLGTLSVTMMAVCYAIGTILNRKLLSGANKIDFFANIYNHHVSSFILLFLVSFTFEKWPDFGAVIYNKKVALSIFYMAFFSTAIAWFLYFYLVKIWSALRASTVSYLIPIMALFWDFLFFKNLPTINEYIGVVMILVGVFLIQFQLTASKPALN